MKSACNRNLLGLRARCPRWSSNATEYALEKARAPGSAFTSRALLLQLFQPPEGVVEFAIRAAARGIKLLPAVRFECPKMIGINPLHGVIKLKVRVVLGLRWEELNEESW